MTPSVLGSGLCRCLAAAGQRQHPLHVKIQKYCPPCFCSTFSCFSGIHQEEIQAPGCCIQGFNEEVISILRKRYPADLLATLQTRSNGALRDLCDAIPDDSILANSRLKKFVEVGSTAVCCPVQHVATRKAYQLCIWIMAVTQAGKGFKLCLLMRSSNFPHTLLRAANH